MNSVFSAPFAMLFGFKLFFNFLFVLSRPIVDMLAFLALEFYQIVLYFGHFYV